MKDETGIVAVVAANVRDARKAAGLTQEELAFESGLDRTYISQVERKLRNPTVTVIARLAHSLNLAASDLLVEPRKVRGASRRRG